MNGPRGQRHFQQKTRYPVPAVGRYRDQIYAAAFHRLEDAVSKFAEPYFTLIVSAAEGRPAKLLKFQRSVTTLWLLQFRGRITFEGNWICPLSVEQDDDAIGCTRQRTSFLDRARCTIVEIYCTQNSPIRESHNTLTSSHRLLG